MREANQKQPTETIELRSRHRRKRKERRKDLRTDSASDGRQPLCRDEEGTESEKGHPENWYPNFRDGRETSHPIHFAPLK